MVWEQIAIAAVAFLVVWLLSPSVETENARAASFKDLRFPQSTEGAPLHLVLGKRRIQSPNTIWLDGYTPIALREFIRTGLFSSEERIVGYRYSLSVALGICIGPGVRLHRIWLDKEEVWKGDLAGGGTFQITEPEFYGQNDGFLSNGSFYDGNSTQPVNAEIEKYFPESPAYGGLSYVVLEQADLGKRPSLPTISFEVSRYTDGLGLGNDAQIGEDLNPAEVLYQILTLDWGGLGFSIQNLDVDTFREVGKVLATEQNGMSVFLPRATDGKRILSEVLRQIDGVLFQNPQSGKLVLKLIRNDYDVTTLPELSEAEIVSVQNFGQTVWEETVNQVRVQYPNRKNKYEQGMAMVQDMANLLSQERVRSTHVAFPHCLDGEQAIRLATRELSQLSVPIRRVVLEVNRAGAIDLFPGSVFQWTWPEYSIQGMILRVQKIGLGSLTDSVIVLECIQDRFASTQNVFAPPEQTFYEPVVQDAGPADAEKVWEVPYFFVQRSTKEAQANTTYVSLFVRSTKPYLFGYHAEIEQQGFPLYTGVRDRVFSFSAVLAKPITVTDGFDGSNFTLSVKEPTQGTDWLTNEATLAEQRLGKNVLLVNNELFTFRIGIEDPMSPGTWVLQNLQRGLLDTDIRAHAVGSLAYLVNADGYVSDPFLDKVLLKTTVIPFTDRKTYRSPSPVQTSPENRYTLPMKPMNVSVDGARVNVELTENVQTLITWNTRSREDEQIRFIADPSVSTANDVTYEVKVYSEEANRVYVTQDDIKVAQMGLMIRSNFIGRTGRIEVYAVQQGRRSLYPDTLPFTIAGR